MDQVERHAKAVVKGDGALLVAKHVVFDDGSTRLPVRCTWSF
jgi:hypothetical protein